MALLILSFYTYERELLRRLQFERNEKTEFLQTIKDTCSSEYKTVKAVFIGEKLVVECSN